MAKPPTSFTLSVSAVRASHPFSLCTTSSPHCRHSPAPWLTAVSSASRTQAGLFQTFGKAASAGLSEGWHFSCIFGVSYAFLRKDPNTEPALRMASLHPHGWLHWRLLLKDTGIQEQERHSSLRPANCHIMPSNRQTLSLQRCQGELGTPNGQFFQPPCPVSASLPSSSMWLSGHHCGL